MTTKTYVVINKAQEWQSQPWYFYELIPNTGKRYRVSKGSFGSGLVRSE